MIVNSLHQNLTGNVHMNKTNIIVGKVHAYRNGFIKKRKVIVMDLKELTEKELTKTLWDAIETQYGWYIELIREEMNRRVREA
jgi:hypothetical protein